MTAGTLGGWLSDTAVLDQKGACWIDDTCTCDKGIITGNALITDNSKIIASKCYDNTRVRSCVLISSILNNVIATNSKLAGVQLTRGMEVCINDSMITDLSITSGDAAVSIAHFKGSHIMLVGGAYITSKIHLATVNWGNSKYAIYPIKEADVIKTIVTEHGKIMTNISGLPEVIKMLYELIKAIVEKEQHSATSETSLFN